MTAHKGDLHASSGEGEGGTFTVILRHEIPKVLVVDIRMSIKMSHIPVIMVTGDSDEGTRERILKLGAQEFVSKPINPGDFVPRVQQFIA